MLDYNSDEAESIDSPIDFIFNDLREQDRYLPIANVGRVMRSALPPQGKLSKEAKETVQECVSEFISFVTSQAAEKCSIEKRKTLNGEDILSALHALGFENYSETLKIFLAKYREFEQYELELKKNSNKPKRAYHRKNPRNRPKNINRYNSSGAAIQDVTIKSNLPTLVPTSLLSIVDDHNIPLPNPQHLQRQTGEPFIDEQQQITSYNQIAFSTREVSPSSRYYTYSNSMSESETGRSVSASDSESTPAVGDRGMDLGVERGSSGSSSGNVVDYGDFMNL